MAGNQTVNTDLTKLNKKDLLKMYIYLFPGIRKRF